MPELLAELDDRDLLLDEKNARIAKLEAALLGAWKDLAKALERDVMRSIDEGATCATKTKP